MTLADARRLWTPPIVSRYGTFAELTLQRPSGPPPNRGRGREAWCSNAPFAESDDDDGCSF